MECLQDFVWKQPEESRVAILSLLSNGTAFSDRAHCIVPAPGR